MTISNVALSHLSSSIIVQLARTAAAASSGPATTKRAPTNTSTLFNQPPPSKRHRQQKLTAKLSPFTAVCSINRALCSPCPTCHLKLTFSDVPVPSLWPQVKHQQCKWFIFILTALFLTAKVLSFDSKTCTTPVPAHTFLILAHSPSLSLQSVYLCSSFMCFTAPTITSTTATGH